MKEKINRSEPTNKVHLHGYINDVKVIDYKNGDRNVVLDMCTIEAWKDNTGQMQNARTYHNVSLVTDSGKLVKRFEDIKADLDNNRAHREEEGFKPAVHTASVDGMFITRPREVEREDGTKVTYYNQIVLADTESLKLDAAKDEKEVRNAAEFKGNIAKIDIKENDKGDKFAIVSVATHYIAPGAKEGDFYSDKGKNYHEETSYVETRVSSKGRGADIMAKINAGELEVGDLVKARGRMHNNNFEDKDGIKRYKVVVDLSSVELVAKKERKAEAEEKKEEKKETKKAAAKKTATKKATSKRSI